MELAGCEVYMRNISEEKMSDETKPKSLSRKQRIFIYEYLKCFNASEAARRAGYTGRPDVIGSRLLGIVSIKAAIDTRISESQMSADEALIRMSQHAKASISDVIDESGNVDWKKVHENGHLVKSISPSKFGTRIEIIDAQAALDKILRVHGKYKDNIDIMSGGEPLTVKVIKGVSMDEI